MTKKTKSQSPTLCSTFYNTGNISHYETLSVTIRYNTQLWLHRCERIICYLRTRTRKSTQQGTLAGIRETDKTDICQKFQFKHHSHLLHRFSGLCIAGSLVRRRAEIPVAQSSPSTFQKNLFLSVLRDVANVFSSFCIVDHSTAGYVNIPILTVSPGTAAFTSGLTVCSEHMALITQVKQCPVVAITPQNDMTATPSVATVRTSVGHVLGTTHMHRAPAALSRAAENLDVIYKIAFQYSYSLSKKANISESISSLLPFHVKA